MPAKDNRYDFIVFGASGFTGQFVVEELLRVSESNSFTWAVAGRNLSKLENVVKTAFEMTGKPSKDIAKIIADVEDVDSLNKMCQQGKVILNCTGPYRLFGEPVVRACIANKADHVDISGEPLFLEKMQLDYHTAAKEAGIYVIGAAGFDSIPCESLVHVIRDKFPGDLVYIESFLGFKTGPEGMKINVGTWNSVVQGVAEFSKLKPLRKQLFPERLPMSDFKAEKHWLYYSKDVNSWCLPFLGADKSIVMRTQQYLYAEKNMRPFQMVPYLRTKSLFTALQLIFAAMMFFVLSSFSFGQSLLKNYPEIFSFGFISKDGATRNQIKDSSFSMTGVGVGHSAKLAEPTDSHTEKPDTKLTVKLKGPDAGYITTPICMVQSGLILLQEREKLPKSGGVYTCGSAFLDTKIIERLQKNSFEFEIGEPEKLDS